MVARADARRLTVSRPDRLMRLAPYSEELSNPAAGDRTLDEILGANAARASEAPALVAPG